MNIEQRMFPLSAKGIDLLLKDIQIYGIDKIKQTYSHLYKRESDIWDFIFDGTNKSAEDVILKFNIIYG